MRICASLCFAFGLALTSVAHAQTDAVRIGVLNDMSDYQVKSPDESKGPWDVYSRVATIAADQAFRPLHEGGCPLVTP